MRRDSFHAIADPTRRQILQLLAVQPMNLNALSEKFTISRPAISKQVKILNECGLVIIHKQGRERVCEVSWSQMHEITAWIDKYTKFWNMKLNKLERILKTPGSGKKKISAKK